MNISPAKIKLCDPSTRSFHSGFTIYLLDCVITRAKQLDQSAVFTRENKLLLDLPSGYWIRRVFSGYSGVERCLFLLSLYSLVNHKQTRKTSGLELLRRLTLYVVQCAMYNVHCTLYTVCSIECKRYSV